MTSSDASEVIRSMSKALAADPSQFHISVNVTGQQVTSYGGTAVNITAAGGGEGSTTIGQSVSLDGSQVTIAQQRANEAMNGQLQALISSLDRIASELERPSPDKSIISGIYESLLNPWVPGVITSVVGTLLAKAIGL